MKEEEEEEAETKDMSILAGGAESEDEATGFNNSLLELKDLCSQLHQAADYCESAFLNASKKTPVVESTKEYVCRAVVTVVDHLGNVSAKLEYELSKANDISQTELRIYSLQQKLMTCQDYSQKLALAKYCMKPQITRYHPRYLSPPVVVHPKSHQFMRESTSETTVMRSVSKNSFKIDEEVPLFLYTYNYKYKPTLVEDSNHNGDEKTNLVSAPVLPVKDGLSLMPKPQPFSFHFQEIRKARRKMLIWKSMQNNDILSLIRRRR